MKIQFIGFLTSTSRCFRLTFVIVIITLLIAGASCKVKKTVQLEPNEVIDLGGEQIVGITTKTGEEIQFDAPGTIMDTGSIKGSRSGDSIEIGFQDIQRYWVTREQTSTSRTIGLVAGVVGGTVVLVAAIAAATKNSCPFVYSWDGNQWIFDAEPYGGAITKGLERDDYAELQNLVSVDGQYRLLIKNEVPETQYTNLMELEVVDHPPGTRVVVERSGDYHTVRRLVELKTAVKQDGTDLSKWLKTKDRLIWEPMPSEEELHETIILSFPKPEDAKSAKLIVNVGTGLWGSYMIREILALRGSELPSWYEFIDLNPIEAKRIHDWSLQTETYALKIRKKTNKGWDTGGILLGEGPFIMEDRIIQLDLRDVSGETLDLLIQPPKGFWAFNSFAIDYSPDELIEITTVKPTRATGNDGENLLDPILKEDDQYYEMPEIGDFAVVQFPEPKRKEDYERTVFLKSRGYYLLHFEGTGVPDSEKLSRLEEDYNYVLRLAAQHYQYWNPVFGNGEIQYP